MNRALAALAGTVGAVSAAAMVGLRRHTAASEPIDYRTLDRVGDSERRRYPAVVVAETVADTAGEASGRLDDYLAGANATSTTLPRSGPIRTQHEPVAMTTLRQPATPGSRLRMGVYLGSSFTPETAPEPTNPTVRLTVETPRTLSTRPVPRLPAVTSLSRLPQRVRRPRPTRSQRTERAMTTLLEGVDAADLVAVGSPFVLSYPRRYLPASLTRTEVAVEVV